MKIMKNNLSTPLPNLQPQPADWEPHVRGRKKFQTFFTPTHVPQNHERDEAVILSRIFLYLGLVLRDPCGLGNPFLPQKTGEDI